MEGVNEEENLRHMLKGELFYAFADNLVSMRNRCHRACQKFNRREDAGAISRREFVRLWRDIINDQSPLPDVVGATIEDSLLFQDDVVIDGSIQVDYGVNLSLGKGVYINYNCVFLDTCSITIGARTLIGPNCSFYTATHPLDPFLRNGLNGPELGAPINVGEDCWFGGNVVVCPGVTIGRGVSVGTGSVVTKDVPAFHLVVGNPARIVKRIEPLAADPRRLLVDMENDAMTE